MTKQRIITGLAVAACCISMIVIMLGSWTRLMDSGLGCPDWPTCYGHFDVRHAIDHVKSINEETPGALREAHKTVPEMVHRYFASTLGLLIVLIALFSQLNRSAEHTPRGLPLFLVALVIFQGILGKWTVTMGLYPPTVTGHLLGGFATFTLLVLFLVRHARWLTPVADPAVTRLFPLAMTALLLLVLQIALGGWTAANYAAASCTELPICNSGWTQKLDFHDAFRFWGYGHIRDFEFGVLEHDARLTIHVCHRIGAILAGLTLLWLSWRTIRDAQTAFYRGAGILLGLLTFIQIGLGVSNVLFQIPITIAVLHNFGGALLLVTLSVVIYSLHQSRTLLTRHQATGS